ncbi:ATP-binding protein [Aquimarina sp. RZ0]|uniref:ATP-binding protein n=1 Tax=Aquimarina sp. RZ0 TaxID=2607730 RepID=UPI0011F27A15|nr:ATP-binding protein [Aquimarina sp. RZ0]KAA1244004.1 sensor histidine kinase [Aquimarina sp. RZ0]
MGAYKITSLIFIFLTIFNISAQDKKEYCEQWHRQMDTIQNYEKALKLCKKILPKVDTTCKTEILISQGYMFLNQRKIDSSFYYLDKGITLAKEIDNTELLSSAYGKKAYVYAMNNEIEKAEGLLKKTRELLTQYPKSEHWILYHQSQAHLADIDADYEKALKHTDSTIILSERNNFSDYLPSCYGNLGTYSIRVSQYEKAADSFLKAIAVLEKESNPSDLDLYYCMLATSYERFSQYDTAIKYFNKAITETYKSGNTYIRMITYSRYADAQRKNDLHTEALESVDSTLAIARELGDQTFISDGLHTRATIYFENLEDYENAEIYFKQAYKNVLNAHSVKRMDDMMLISAIDGMAKINLHKKKYTEAKKYIDLLEEKVDESNVLIFKEALHKYKSEYYENIGQSELALKNLKKYHSIKDSIANSEVKTKVADLEKKYDTKKKELEIVTLSKEKEKQEKVIVKTTLKQNLFLGFSIVLILFLLSGSWGFYKLQKQKQKLIKAHSNLTELNNVKNHLFSIIAHDLRGMLIPFQRSGKILKYHIDNGNHQRTIELAQEIEKNSDSLSSMLDNLLNWSLDQMNGYTINREQILVGKQLKEISSSFNQHAVYKNTKIEIMKHEEVCLLFDKGAFHVIFRNLIGNALKYTENGNIRVEFKKDFNRLLCSVIDTGIGMSENQLNTIFKLEKKQSTTGTRGEKGIGLGLNLVYRFVKMNQGLIEVSSNKRTGTRFDLSFPILELLTKDRTKDSEPLST